MRIAERVGDEWENGDYPQLIYRWDNWEVPDVFLVCEVELSKVRPSLVIISEWWDERHESSRRGPETNICDITNVRAINALITVMQAAIEENTTNTSQPTQSSNPKRSSKSRNSTSSNSSAKSQKSTKPSNNSKSVKDSKPKKGLFGRFK